ncbi:50S ribosomal protein L19 [Candidatus Oleimmundimicrobium sp.]|uniref:50S ribosomal protein L19 n=1 Tax=Candidatus Oleimmundimicrobium sp. TaxID=3060597 RepID=UPI0027266A2A|nr:50S ribosomal protein L19 [Candidatus Oleimmundimicrobium sp.]MDO8885366.1 50S ribosomal protein L19 [Candidatus Oleimmundimicrobium sp.]
MANIIESLENEQMRTDLPNVRVGDTVNVHVKIAEGGKERIQVFKGIVIRKQKGKSRETFTVRKISFGVGVEKTFPVHSPKIVKIESLSKGHVRRSKLYYLRNRIGKRARLKEKRM